MDFVGRFGTTGKVSIPEALQKSLKLNTCMILSKKIGENNIPLSLVLNLDRTSSKYVPAPNKTLAQKGAKTVSMKGSNDKRMITATFTITLDHKLLPMLLIYGGKMQQSLFRVMSASTSSLNGNPKQLFDTSPKRGRDWD